MCLWYRRSGRLASIAVSPYGEAVSRRSLVVLAAIVSQIAISIVQFGLPALTFALRDDRGFGPVAFAVLFGATGIGPALALLPAGRACDRIGARPVLVFGAVVGSVPLAVVGLVHGLAPMVALLLLAGIGSAAVPVAGLTALIAQFPPERRGRLLGLRQAAVPIGGFTGAWLLPALHDAGGLELAFAVPAALVAAGGLFFAAVVGGIDVRRVPPPWRASFPPALRWVMLTGAFYVTTLGGVLTFTVAALHEAGYSEHTAEILFAVVNLGAAAARITWGLVADGAGGTRRTSTLVGLGILGAVTVLVFPLAIGLGVGVAAVACVLLSFGTLGFNGVVYVTAGEAAGKTAGVAVGAASTVVFFTGSATTPGLGWVAQQAGYGVMFALLALFCIAGSLSARKIGAQRARPA
jgi:MFS family permease